MQNNFGFSFNYDGKLYRSCENDFVKNGDSLVFTVEKGVTVTAQLKDISEYNALGWVLYFENKSGENSGVFSDINDCDITLPLKHDPFPRAGYLPCDSNLRVISMHGMVEGYNYNENDALSAKEYSFSTHFLNSPRAFRNISARSSDGTLPFFNVKGIDGAIVAIGWTGSWKADFAKTDDGVSVKTGLAKTGFYLKDGEKLRTSSVLVMNYSENEDFSNKFRKVIKNHYSHKACTPATRDGIFACELWGGITSEEMTKRLARYKEHGISFEDIWIDAGWYGECTDCPDPFTGDWYRHTGNWEVNKNVHPDDLCDVRDEAAKNNSRIMLWFEPERAVSTTGIMKDRPDWFIALPHYETGDFYSRLLYYGNKEAREYVKNVISDYVTKLNLSVYRQDFNCSADEFFSINDEENRVGITEISHITGMYEIWDYLTQKHPGLLIDNCSSGGRRIDIETLSRSIIFFRSDYQCGFNANAEVLQAHNNIATYLPYNGCTTKVKSDDYTVRSSYSSSWGAAFYNTFFQSMDEQDMAWAKKICDEYLRIRKYFSENFYSHASKIFDTSSWAVFQYHDEKIESGVVLAFRRCESPFDRLSIKLCGVKDGTKLVYENFNNGETHTSDNTLEIILPEKRSSVIFEYKKA